VSYFVNIISNSENTPFYVGVTNNLEKRIYEHKNKVYLKSYSTKYNLDKLLYWEISEDITSAIAREKQLKNWHKEWKENLIKTINYNFQDLSTCLNYLNLEIIQPLDSEINSAVTVDLFLLKNTFKTI
jgi:putative endonuclease